MGRLIRKKSIIHFLHICTLAVAVLLIFGSYKNSQESTSPMGYPMEFQGEYRQGEEDWQEYRKGQIFSSLEGDLVLRGRFIFGLLPDRSLSMYLNHIEATILVDGQVVFRSIPGFPLTKETVCVKSWYIWEYEEVREDCELEIRLHNPHKVGNIHAYNEFLNSVYNVPEVMIESQVQNEKAALELLAALLVIAATAVLGIAAWFGVLNMAYGKFLWHLGLTILFMGAYFFLDTQVSIIEHYKNSLWSDGLLCCVMLGTLELAFSVQECLDVKRRRKLFQVPVLLALYDICIFLIPLWTDYTFYDTLPVWMVGQSTAFLVLLVLSVKEVTKKWENTWTFLKSGTLLMVVILAEFVNSFFGWWNQGGLVKLCFIVVMFYHMLAAMRTVPVNYRASEEAKRLNNELKNSRIVLAMSQIRTHFIFNVLNSISGMCLYDPEEANVTIVRFARYLRGNINILQKDELIPFQSELEHVEDYIALEKVRFEEKIKYEKEIAVKDFLIPPLVIQPIVENAIKHGLLKKKEGGHIWIRTRKRENMVEIEIEDDGVGFDTSVPMEDTSVGLDNVEFRVKHMIDGKMRIESVPERGTKVIIVVPGQNGSCV